MSRKLLFQIVSVIALVVMVAGCGGAATPAPQPAATAAPAAIATQPPAATAAPAAAAGGDVKGKFYWVQSSAWHPVHQYTQQGFLAGCEAAGLDCALATTDENTIEALVALAEQTIAKPDAKGVAMWFGGSPVAKPIIEKAKALGIPVVLPHFPVEEGFYADNSVQIAADTTKYPDPVAKAMCDELAKQGIKEGSIAITENGHNATEDMVAKVFSEGIQKYCPQFKLLDVQLEGPEPTQAIAVATSIIQANPDIVAALSTTGGGPTTWAGAQKETGKKVISVGMDATEVNLDLVKNGEVWGLVAQPLYDETFGSGELLYKMANGQEVPYWTVLEAPLVTKDNLQPFYDILAKLTPKFRQAVNPDDKAAVATATAEAGGAAPAAAAGGDVKGKFYWVQSSAWHPVHQYTQQGFLAGCEAAGLDCALATTDENTIEALVALAEQTIAKPDAKGVAMWFGGSPVAKPIIEKAKALGIPVVLPHFPVEEGFYADNSVQIAADTTKYPDPVAKAMCDELAKQGIKEGSIAITENGHNATEDMVAKVFSEGIQKYCPQFKLLDVQLEGPEPTQAIAVATSIIQANPDIVAALSTTGGGPTTWAGAQKETGKKVISVGMDATEVNLDLVKNGEVWGLVAQPLYDETFGSGELLYKMANGQEVPYWTVLEAPLVTKDNLQPFYDILAKLTPKFRQAVNPDDKAAVATATAEAIATPKP